MTELTVIEYNGTEVAVDAQEGSTLMEAVVASDAMGIDGDCGGGCACGTCHCFVDSAWLALLPPVDPMEEAMLRNRPDRQVNSRLACQITISAELAGMVVRLPEYQM
jgi:2Fe-2S ferredoxin